MSGFAVAVECAIRRVRTRWGRLLAIVAAIAVGVAGLMLVAVASTIAGDRALQRGVADLDPEARAFTVTIAPDVAPGATEITALDAKIDPRLQRHGLGPTLHTVEFRPLGATDGRAVRFAGIDDLRSVTRLIDGSWPSKCDPTACEVVAIVADPSTAKPVEPFPADSALGLTIVGTAVATNDLVLGGQLRPDVAEQIVLADGVAAASAVPALQLFRRTYAWQTPVVPEQLRSIDVDALAEGVRAISSDSSLPGVFVSGPEAQLQVISSRTRITNNRLAVPIGALLVLFFGVATLAGLGGRADHQRTVAVLRRRGAGRGVIGCFRLLEVAFPVVVGLIVGTAIALPVGAWLGRRAGLGGWSIVQRSIDASVVLRVLAVALLAMVLIFAVLGIAETRPAARHRRVLPSDIAGAAGLAVLGVLIARGSISTGSLDRSVDPTLVAVPVLAALVLAAVVVRVVPLVLRATSTASPRRWPLTKLTLAEATAQPLRSIATASLIAVTVMFSLLTFGYASTLRLGSRDQAAFAVPYDFRLQLGPQLVRPQTIAPATGWSALAPGTTATDVLRRGVVVRPSATTSQTVELLGIDPDTLSSLHGWRSSFGPPPSRLAQELAVAGPADLGTRLPADAISIGFSGTGFDGLHTSAVIDRVDGTWHEITLDDEIPGGVETALTPGDAGGELIGFRLAVPADVSARIEHHVGEGNTDASAQAVDVALDSVTTTNAAGRSTPLALRADQLRAANASVTAQASTGVRVTGSLLGVAILVTPSPPALAEPLDALVDPATARTAVNGVIVAETSNGSVRLRPTVVAQRFPGAGARFAVVDIDVLQPALDLLQPGAGTPNELWLATDTTAHEHAVADALDGPGFGSVVVDRRTTRQESLATDPLAVVTMGIFVASALVAIVLGVCAVLFGAAADSGDDRPLLRMLALERVRGRKLVAMIAGKSLAAICLAIPLGLIGGRWLLQIATRLVAVSATSGRPNPPLRLAVPWIAVASLSVALVVVLGLGALCGALSARRVPHEDLMRGTT